MTLLVIGPDCTLSAHVSYIVFIKKNTVRYKENKQSRQGQPQIYAFGINYDGYLDTHARDFMYHLSTIKYPVAQ